MGKTERYGCAFCAEFQYFQSCLSPFVFILLTSLLNFLDLSFTEFISESHIYHPDIVTYNVLFKMSIPVLPDTLAHPIGDPIQKIISKVINQVSSFFRSCLAWV